MRRALSLSLFAFLLPACGAEFDPFHLANKFRILTIKTDPPELVIDPGLLTGMPTGPVELPPPVEMTALHPPVEGASWRWDVCLFSLDALNGFECVDPALEVTLPSTTNVATLDLIQVLTAVTGGLAMGGEGEGEGEMPMGPAGCPVFLALPDGSCLSRLDIQVKVTAGLPGEEIVAVRKVPVWFDAARVPNTNPDVRGINVEGDPVRGGEVTLTVDFDDASLEEFVDTDGDTRTELPVFSWFTTAGELQPGATFDDDRDTTLVLPDEDGVDSVEIYVVVRDGDERRGIDFETLTITLSD